MEKTWLLQVAENSGTMTSAVFLLVTFFLSAARSKRWCSMWNVREALFA